jgi:8-oxo-dGTP diphosphatase
MKKVLTVVAAAIFNHDRLLVCRRADEGRQALKWELPGGTVEQNETLEFALVREMQEELSINVDVKTLIGESVLRYEYVDIHLHVYLCEITSGVLTLNYHTDMKWVTQAEVYKLDLIPGDIPFIKKLPWPEAV